MAMQLNGPPPLPPGDPPPNGGRNALNARDPRSNASATSANGGTGIGAGSTATGSAPVTGQDPGANPFNFGPGYPPVYPNFDYSQGMYPAPYGGNWYPNMMYNAPWLNLPNQGQGPHAHVPANPVRGRSRSRSRGRRSRDRSGSRRGRRSYSRNRRRSRSRSTRRARASRGRSRSRSRSHSRSSSRGHERNSEYDGRASEEDGGSAHNLKKLADELNVDLDYVNYRSKLVIAAGILQVDITDKDDDKPSLVSRDKRQRTDIEFPFSPILAKRFEASWASASGEVEFQVPEVKDILSPPGQGIKTGKRARPKGLPKQKWYKVKEESNPGWPLESCREDSEAKSTLKTYGQQYRKPLDDWMEMNGKLLQVLNQFSFFNQAAAEVVTALDADMPQELKERWDILKDFGLVQSQSLEDCIAVSTNMMVNLLLEKREATVQNSKMPDQDKPALKFVTPLDKQHRLFSGKINEYWKAKKEIGSSRVSEEMISFLKRQGRKSSPAKSSSRNYKGKNSGERKDEGYKDNKDYDYNYKNKKQFYKKPYDKKDNSQPFRGSKNKQGKPNNYKKF